MNTRYEFAELIDKMQLKQAAEIGVAYGAFSEYLLKHSSLDVLWSIDAWQSKNSDMALAQAKSALAHYGSRSKIMHAPSQQAVTTFADASLDFIYIDADHRYKGVSRDISLWWPKLRPGGVFAGHDYVEASRTGVIDAVNEFMEGRAEQLHLTKEKLSSWWLIKQ